MAGSDPEGVRSSMLRVKECRKYGFEDIILILSKSQPPKKRKRVKLKSVH